MRKLRLDQLLVDRGLAESREKAKALVLAGQVLLDGQKAAKPGHTVPEESRLELTGRMPYVSRAGLKLAAALDHFSVRVEDRVCLDVGSSTGGFTDCLLQRGAARVYAIDAGQGQLDWKLRNDPRVIVREGVNARYLQRGDLAEQVDLAVCDVSFISATLVMPAIVSLMQPDGEMVILVKPQFEAGRSEVGRGGIVRDPETHRRACEKVARAAGELGFKSETMASPVLGAEGNQEFLLYARR